MIYAFNGYEVDTERIELRQEGTAVHIEPQVFDVLCYLLEHRDRAVSKIEMFDKIWGGAFVGESTLTSRIKSVRRAVGDNGQEQNVIRTIQRRGYQFVADVQERTRDGEGHAPEPDGAAAPAGTISFLFTDIEGSSQLWERHQTHMEKISARHDEILHSGIGDCGGVVFASGGDGVAAAFGRASDAVAAARRIRQALNDESWPESLDLRVRIGVHTGEATRRDGNYFGSTVNRASRVMDSAHGGQTLVSDVTAGLLTDEADLVDLGICQIDPAMPAIRLWQVGDEAFPPLPVAMAATPPTLRTRLIGRADELEQVSDAVAEHRLVSIVGPGGMGKTTLSLAVANHVIASFPAGVIFAELAAVRDGGGIFRAVGEAAGLEGAAAMDAASLAGNIARRSVLLVLDNCEHLIDECADFVDELLDAGAEATVLTTSREPLGVDGERVLHLDSLDLDAPELFIARGDDAQPGIELDADDARVVHLCQRLDGLPLAIELAAAQLRHLSLDDLVARLDDALELSRGGRTRGRDRHATLDRTIAWSYDLLDEPSQWLLRQFGVFPGSFDLVAAEAVGHRNTAISIVPTLSELVAKSLLVCDAITGRYRLLETVRAFSVQRLDEFDEAVAAEERLRCHVVGRATATSRDERWLSGDHAARVRADLDIERLAFDRSMWAGNVVDALEIYIGCSYLFRNTTSCVDGRKWGARLDLVAEELEPRDLLWMTLVHADVAQGTADHSTGRALAKTAMELSGDVDDPAATTIALHLAALHLVVVAPDEARQQLGAAIEVSAALDDPRLEQLMRAFMAVTELSAGNVELGSDLAESIGHEVDGGGYEVFIANWAAWTATLMQADAARLRYWTERQRTYLTRAGVPEPWLFVWSAALLTSLEGGDASDGLRAARARADSEGHDISADVVLALAIIARHDGDHVAAAEMLGVVKRQTLNNLSHYVYARELRAFLSDVLGADAMRTALSARASSNPTDVLAELGLGIAG